MSAAYKPAESHVLELARAGSLTDSAINMITGVKIQRVRALRELEGVPSVTKWTQRKPLSDTHVGIGMRLAYVRVLNDGKADIELVTRLGWTITKYNRVEKGIHPLELSDILNLARVFNCTPSDILTMNFGD